MSFYIGSDESEGKRKENLFHPVSKDETDSVGSQSSLASGDQKSDHPMYKRTSGLLKKLHPKYLRNHRVFKAFGRSHEEPHGQPTNGARPPFKRSISHPELGMEPIEEAEENHLDVQEFPHRPTPRRWASVPRRLSICPDEDDEKESSKKPREEKDGAVLYNRLPAAPKTTLVDEASSSTTNNPALDMVTPTKFAEPDSGETTEKGERMFLEKERVERQSPDSTTSPVKKGQHKSNPAAAPRPSVPFTRGSSIKQFDNRIKTVAICLIEGRDLPAMDRNGLSDPFCKFKLGAEKHRSRTAFETLNPRWMESFDLSLFDEVTRDLEITVWDYDRGMKNDYMGKVMIDLSTLEMEKMHDLWLSIIDDSGGHCGSLHLTISVIEGAAPAQVIDSIPAGPPLESSLEKEALQERYHVRNTMKQMGDVGILTIRVKRASGLLAADLNGRSDPYCLVTLDGNAFSTHVIPKTLDPEWNCSFTYPLTDVHSVLEVTVFDRDQDQEPDFLGRIAIPLLRIRNNEPRWFALKDRTLTKRSKGAILLEMEMIYNPLRAAYKTINPRSRVARVSPEPKFQRQILVRNLLRLRPVATSLLWYLNFFQSLFEWEDLIYSSLFLIIYVLVVVNFDWWMVPVFFLLLFLRSWVHQKQQPNSYAREEDAMEGLEDYPLDVEDAKGDEDQTNTSIVSKLKTAQRGLGVVQGLTGDVADLLERAESVLTFACPWLSQYAVVVLCLVTVILYIIPLRWIVLAWGIKKMLKKLIKKNSQSVNEVKEFLSRAYTRDQIKAYQELRPKDLPTLAASVLREGSSGSP